MEKNVNRGGRPKGKYALIAIMRTGPDVIVTRKYTTRDKACEVAAELNRTLQLDDPVIAYCVRSMRRGWFKP